MKSRLFLISILPLALSGCGASSGVSYDIRPGYPFINRNGDILDQTRVTASFDEVARKGKAEEMKARIENEKPFLLYLYGNSCIHCEDIHNVVVGFIEKHDIELFAIEANHIHAEMDPIVNAFPGLGISSANYRTPTLYLIENASRCKELSIANHAQTIQRAEEAILPYINLPYSYTLRTASGFSSFLDKQEETYLYFEAKEDDLGREALGIDASRRAVGIVESSFFSEADWIQLTETVGEDLEGKLAHYEKEKGFTSLTDYSEADEAFLEFIA